MNIFGATKWILLIAGTLLFLVSMIIEGLVLSMLFGYVLIGGGLAIALEITKVVSIVVDPVVKAQHRGALNLTYAFVVLLRYALLILSVLCSSVYLAINIDRPLLNDVFESDKTELATQRNKRERQAQLRYEDNLALDLASLAQANSSAVSQLDALHLPAIEALETTLLKEMDNVVNDNFIGPRYRELQSRIKHHRSKHQEASARLMSEQKSQQQSVVARHRTELQQQLGIVAVDFDGKMEVLKAHDYADDERASLPIITSTKRLLNNTLRFSLNDLQVGMIFSVFISVVGELALYCLFSQFAVLVSSVLISQHTLWQHQTVARTNVKVSLNKRRAAENAHRDSVQQRRADYEEKLGEALGV